MQFPFHSMPCCRTGLARFTRTLAATIPVVAVACATAAGNRTISSNDDTATDSRAIASNHVASADNAPRSAGAMQETAPRLPGLDEENLPIAPEDATEGPLQVSFQTGYESLRISSGMQSGYVYIQSDLGLQWYGATVAFHAENPLDTEEANPAGPFNPEYSIDANYAFVLGELLNASIGFTYYWLPRRDSTPNRHREINLGLEADLPLSPQLIYNYDFDLRQNEVVLQLSHETPLDAWLPLEGFSLGAALALGYLHAARPESDQGPKTQESLSYLYTEIALNLSYRCTEHVSFYAGPRFATNDSSRDNIADRKSNLWWGMGCCVDF